MNQPTSPLCGRSRAVRAFPLLLAACLALALTLVNMKLQARPMLQQRLALQQQVLHNQADNYYQYDLYFLEHVASGLQGLGLPPLAVVVALFGLGYGLAMLASWYWLAQLFKAPGAIVLGLLATALYAFIMVPLSYDHPADMFALAAFALSLGLVARGQWPWLLVVSLAAGLFSSKQLLIAAPAALALGRRLGWPRGVATAGAAAALALAVPLLYLLRLGPHAVTPLGLLPPALWLRDLPESLVVHLVMAAAPLASVLIFRPRAPQVVWGAWLAYLGLLLICAVQFNIIHEARTFWIAIPAFAASLAFWGEHTAEAEPSGASDCRH